MDSNVYKTLQKRLQSQLKKIERFADQKAEEIEAQNYAKYHQFYDIAISVLRKHPVLMYGGTAINEALPVRKRFYKKTELPDVDVFCTDYEPIAKEMVETFAKEGYSMTTVTEALHENTYKVMAEGLQLIDLTVIDKEAFENLRVGGVETSFGIPTVSIDFLKYSMHSILSQPFDANRWPKVFQRIVRLYESYPVKLKCRIKDVGAYSMEIPQELVEAKDRWAKQKNMLSFGWDVIRSYLQEDKTIQEDIKKEFLPPDEGMAAVQYLVIDRDVLGAAKEWIREREDKNLRIERIYPKQKFMLPYVCISYKGQRWLYLFESPICVSYQEYKGKNILTIHSLLRFLYEMYLTSLEPDLYCIIQLLTAIYINNLLSTKKIFQQYILYCYGFQKGVITLRKEKFQRQLKKKKKGGEE